MSGDGYRTPSRVQEEKKPALGRLSDSPVSTEMYPAKQLAQRRSVRSLLTREDHHRIARQLKAEKVSGSKLDPASLFLSATRHDTEPAGLFPTELPLLAAGFVTVQFNKSIRVAFTLAALEDDVLIERLNAVEERASGGPQSAYRVDWEEHVEVPWSGWALNTVYNWEVE